MVCAGRFKGKTDKRLCQECGGAMCRTCTHTVIISNSTRQLTDTCTTCTTKIVHEHAAHNEQRRTARSSGKGAAKGVGRVELVELVDAGSKALLGNPATPATPAATPDHDKYVQVSLVTLQHIQLGVFVRAKYNHRLTNVATDTVACGLGGVWGNKGGVGVSFQIDGVNTLSFVAAHLAARASNKRDRARNRDFHKIMKHTNIAGNHGKGDDLYSTTDHLWFLGDLNYRVTYGHPGEEAEFELVKQTVRAEKYEELMTKDQLTGHIAHQRSFVNFQEAAVHFPPTVSATPITTESRGGVVCHRPFCECSCLFLFLLFCVIL